MRKALVSVLGIAAAIPELPDGFIQGSTFLGTYRVDGAADLNPTAGAFEFDITSLAIAAGTDVTITANYSASTNANSATITSLFSVPADLQQGTGGTPATIATVSRSGNDLTITWTGGVTSDHAAIHDGYIAVTPLQMDLTNYGLLETVRGWDLTT